jgi:hypothetical protein
MSLPKKQLNFSKLMLFAVMMDECLFTPFSQNGQVQQTVVVVACPN